MQENPFLKKQYKSYFACPKKKSKPIIKYEKKPKATNNNFFFPLAITSKYHNTHLPSRTIFKYKHTGHTSE
jgi:hypothetical protein